MKTKFTLLVVMLVLPLLLGAQQLQQINSFGSNPGQLNMYLYAPNNMPANAPVVVAMHGCTQNGLGFANETGWNTLADRYKFYVIYPEQRNGNNSSGCFNWFENSDINRGQGEPRSIISMVDYVKNNFSVDSDKVFATGFSAGGAMTCVMLATYPDVFRGGAVMAGIPYRAAIGLIGAFQALNPGINQSPNQWGNSVRNATSYTGPWPKVAVFHGTSDFTVNNSNLQEVVEQWTNVNGADANADATDNSFDGNSSVRQRVYNDGNGQAVVVAYDITGMGHTVAIDPGSGPQQGGTIGSYSSDEDFYSCFWAADFWGITGGSQPPVTVADPSGLSAAAVSQTGINLSWTDNANNETNYLIERSSSAGAPFVQIASLGANANSFADSGLSAGTTYFYRVRATNGSVNSNYSNIASATTSAGGGTPQPPAAPSNLSAVAQGQTIVLNWIDNSNNETGLDLQRSLSPGSGFVSIANLGANTTTFTDQGLVASTTYYYRLRATNADGNSSFSNTASAQTVGTAVVQSIEQNQQQGFIGYFNIFDCGQSFTLPEAGTLTQIDVFNRIGVSNSTLRIFSGNTTSGTPLYEQSGISLGSGWQSIILNTPQALSSGQYTFELSRSTFGYTFTDTYAGGQLFYNNFGYVAFDATFRIFYETIPGGAVFQGAPNRILGSEIGKIEVFPNPTSGSVHIQLPSTFELPLQLRLMDGQGRSLQLIQLNDYRLELGMEQWPAGLYRLQVSEGEQQLVKTIVKQ